MIPYHEPTRLAIAAVLRGPFTVAGIAAALAAVRGRPGKVLVQIATQLVARFGDGRRPRRGVVAAFLLASARFRRAMQFAEGHAMAAPRPSMQPHAGAPQTWEVPPIETIPALAAWLRLSPDELRALTAPWRSSADDDRARCGHYHYRWVARRGGVPRLIEAPKAQLKAAQRRILRRILARIPAHPAAHGFVSRRNIVSFVSPHAGQACVLRMDVQDFFASYRRARVLAVFVTAGYPEPVAAALADLCTTITPARVCAALDARSSLREKLRMRHLPQGAPTSPALANLCAFALDARLAGLAARFGACYTRYADDLLFSGERTFARDAARCEVRAGAILLEEGLAAAHRKTKIMRRGVSQRAAGLVLNDHPAVPRRERRLLEAILTNCRQHGPASQNRAGRADFGAHLLGRIAHVSLVQPEVGARLRASFAAIDWPADR